MCRTPILPPGRTNLAPLCYYQGRFNMIEDLLQPKHLLMILLIALLFFGPQKLPELGKGLAQGIRSFKDSLKSVNPDDSAQPPKA
jgi:sec-independent protein translocase protein TatA